MVNTNIYFLFRKKMILFQGAEVMLSVEMGMAARLLPLQVSLVRIRSLLRTGSS